MRPNTPHPAAKAQGMGAGLNRRLRQQGIYLLPNLFTLAALFSGFYAIVQAMNGRFEAAAMAIFASMVLDGMDGRVARWTRTQSAFGAEFDSLADMVSFGVAPALVAYTWQLRLLPHPKLGWAIAFIYCAGAALRLARFNTQLEVADKRWFQGLPSPTAAALVAGLVWLSIEQGWTNLPAMRWITLGITLFAGLTMVSNVPYYSFKAASRRAVSFMVMVALLFGFGLIATTPEFAIFVLVLLYSASGYVIWLQQYWARRRNTPSIPS